MKFIVLSLIVEVVVSQGNQGHANQGQYHPQQQQYQDSVSNPQTSDRQFTTTTYVPILQWNKEQEHDGTYRTSYETGNNIIAEESGYIKTIGEGADKVEGLVQQGSYSYMSPDGQVITVHYTADETGFHATGDHIPTPPPVSEEIQKGLDLIYAGIRQQKEAEDRETAQESQMMQNHENGSREDQKKYRP